MTTKKTTTTRTSNGRPPADELEHLRGQAAELDERIEELEGQEEVEREAEEESRRLAETAHAEEFLARGFGQRRGDLTPGGRRHVTRSPRRSSLRTLGRLSSSGAAASSRCAGS